MPIKYVDFEKMSNGNLKVTLNDAGRQEMEECPDTTIYVLLAHQLCNGWENLDVEDVGGLTSCDLIISEDVTRDDDGDVKSVGTVYWHERYQIEDPVEELRKSGYFVLVGVVGEAAPEDADPTECEVCGEELDRDCNGSMRCPSCDGPCPCCDDGGGPV